MKTRRNAIALLWILGQSFTAAFMAPLLAATTTTAATNPDVDTVTPIALKDVATKVAVAGATGRTGRFVVDYLLEQQISVVAMVRTKDKAKEVFSDPFPEGLEVVACDLSKEDKIKEAVEGCDAAIWCATGFSDAPDSPWNKVKKLFGIALAPQQSIDVVGVPALAKCFSDSDHNTKCPKIVMLSSAGVTRPSWSEQKKAMFPGSAEIPIVRLNPFGILDIKRESEEKLRESGVDYCIVRPAGLNDKVWPSGCRPVFSQGDIAAGRTTRKDVAKVLVDVLAAPEATGKTFEFITLAGYPPARSLGPALSKLKLDSEGLPSMEAMAATYSAMQQLLPGEKQDSQGIALGQSYEQLDREEAGPFGKRGEETLDNVPTTPTS